MVLFRPMTKQYRELPQGLLLGFQTWPQSGLTDGRQGWTTRRAYVRMTRTARRRVTYTGTIWSVCMSWTLTAGGWDSTEPDHLGFRDSDLDLPTAMGPFRHA